jgi:hypothetical protein
MLIELYQINHSISSGYNDGVTIDGRFAREVSVEPLTAGGYPRTPGGGILLT